MRVEIAGAGPAGCAAAIVLARAGVPVTLWTGRRPAQHHGSETLHPGVEPLLRQLGAAGVLARAHRSWAGWEVDRDAFDAALRAVAATAGSGLYAQTHAGCLPEGAWLLDATGRRRLLARTLSLNVRTAGPPAIAWRGVVSGYHEADGQRFFVDPSGWSWIAPEPSGRCTWTRLGSRQPPEVLRGCETAAAPRGYPVQRTLVRPCAGPGWMLLGDAAATVEPATGQGVLSALASGMRAARALLAVRSQPALETLWLARYDDAVTRRWETEVRELGQRAGPTTLHHG